MNIYEIALPWAVRKALGPSTDAGAAVLRRTVLADDKTFRWANVDAIVDQHRAETAAAGPSAAATGSGEPSSPAAEATSAAAETSAPAAEGSDAEQSAPASGRGRLMAAEAAVARPEFVGADAAAQAVHAAKPGDALGSVLGSSAGHTLRRAAWDLDLADLLLGAARRRNRGARRLAVAKLSEALDAFLGRRFATAPPEASDARPWPRSAASRALAARDRARARAVSRLLLRKHLRGLASLRGARAALVGCFVGARVAVDAAARSLWRFIRRKPQVI